jgi:exosortase/archaeosortase family protein
VKLQREWLLLLGSLFVAGALYGHYMGHSALLVEMMMLAIGTGLALYATKGIAEQETEASNGLLFTILSRYVRKESCALIISGSGFILLFAWSAWKVLILKSPDMRLEDFIVTLFGISLVLYNVHPTKTHLVQDFAVLYLMFLTIVFVVIWRTYSLVTGESYVGITAYAEYYIVTLPVTSILNLFGFNVSSELNLHGFGLSNIINYQHDNVTLKLGIGTGCSGLYSAGLFFSAFLAFVLVRYRRVDMTTGIALGIGFALTWLSNIIRMIITIMTGIIWGHPALAFVHAYIGILIFVAFVTVFWILVVKWLDRSSDKKLEKPPMIDAHVS